MVGLVNLYQQPLDKDVFEYYNHVKEQNNQQNILKIIGQELLDRQMNFKDLLQSKKFEYEKV